MNKPNISDIMVYDNKYTAVLKTYFFDYVFLSLVKSRENITCGTALLGIQGIV